MVWGYATAHLKGGMVGPPYTLGGHGLSGRGDSFMGLGGSAGMSMAMSQYKAEEMGDDGFDAADTYGITSHSEEYGLQQAGYRSTMKYTDATVSAADCASSAYAASTETTPHEGLRDGKTMALVPHAPPPPTSRTVDEMMSKLCSVANDRQQSAGQMYTSMTVEDAWAVVDTNGRTPSTFPEPGEIPGAELLCMSGVKASINTRPGKRTDAIRQQTLERNNTIPRFKPADYINNTTSTQHFIAPLLPAEAAAEAAAIAYYEAVGHPSMTHQQLQQTFGGEAMGAHGASLIHSTGLPHTSWPVKQAGQPHPTLSDSVVLEPRRRTATAPRGRSTPFGSTVSRFRNKVPKGCTNAPAVIETRGRAGLDAPPPGHCHPNMNADRSLSRNAFDGGPRRGVSNNANVNYNIRSRPNVVVRSESRPVKNRTPSSRHLNAPKPRSHYRETGRPPRRTVSRTQSHVKTSGIFY